MKRPWVNSTVLVFLLMSVCSCSIISRELGPRAEGEVRLKRLHLPVSMQVGISYDARVDFEADGDAVMKRVCLRWVGENLSVSSPSLYCYAQETQSNQPMDASCPRWVAEGPFTAVSSVLCLDVTKVRFDEPGRFMVSIPESFIRPEYNRLVCYVEYMRGDSLAETNKVSGKTLIEK